MIDIHCHILPGIDDGSTDLDETIKMCKIAVSEGIHHIIATPHYIQYHDCKTRSELKPLLEMVNEKLKEECIELQLSIGHEVYVTPDLVSLIQLKEVATLNDSRYLLIEFPMNSIPPYIEELIYELKLIGVTPIIAHPERYREIIENPNSLIKYIELGALCQSNVGSINGLFGSEIQKTVMTLIKHQMVHFVATDAHTSSRRAPLVKEAFSRISDIDENMAEALFNQNPLKVHENLDIETKAPILVEKQSFIKRFFSRKC